MGSVIQFQGLNKKKLKIKEIQVISEVRRNCWCEELENCKE